MKALKIKNSNMTRSRWIFAGIFGGITLVIYLIFCVYPLLDSIYMSFFNWNGYYAIKPDWIGFENYKGVLTDEIFWRAVKNDFIITLIKEVVIIFLVVLFAVTLTRFKLNKAESAFYKFVFYIPNILSVIIIGTIWRFIFLSGECVAQNVTSFDFEIGEGCTRLFKVVAPGTQVNPIVPVNDGGGETDVQLIIAICVGVLIVAGAAVSIVLILKKTSVKKD